MKVCNVGMVSRLLVVVFLVLLIVLCSFGLKDSGKYSCDNGIFVSNDYDFNNPSKKCQDALLNKCASKCNPNAPPNRECMDCLNNNGCKYFKCIEGHTSEIILIIIISLTGIFLLFKLFCMFQKKGPMAMM